MAMPWGKAKAKAADYREGRRNVADLTRLFDACFRIQREASQAAGKRIPLVVENVRGAQPWVGRAVWKYGSYYLWGDVPALVPLPSKALRKGCTPGASKRGFSGPDWGNPSQLSLHPITEAHYSNGIKQGGTWWHDPGSISRLTASNSRARKFASAIIAKIPLPLSYAIAQAWFPVHPAEETHASCNYQAGGEQ